MRTHNPVFLFTVLVWGKLPPHFLFVGIKSWVKKNKQAPDVLRCPLDDFAGNEEVNRDNKAGREIE